MTPRAFFDRTGHPAPATVLDERSVAGERMAAETFADVQRRAGEGERLLDARDYRGAFQAFRAALLAVPEPLEAWHATGWLLVAMGEAAILAGDFRAAFPPLRESLQCFGTIGNPWVHLRIGQARMELGDPRAVDDLARAYMGGGRAIFDGLDAKYLAVVEQELELPPGTDRLP